MNIQNFFFPVAEKPISLFERAPWENKIDGYKAIVATDNKHEQVISVVKDSYKLVQNEELIEPLLDEVSKLGVRWRIDPSHTFCQLNRMRLQITFPDILLKDGDSDIALSVYLHNSYDQSEGVRAYWGAIRGICQNGCVFGDILGSIYARHTSGFSFDNFYEEFGYASDKIQDVQKRISQMESDPVDEELMKQLQSALGKRRFQEITDTDKVPDKSQWDLLNDITYYISHDVEKPKRGDLQLKISKALSL